MGTRGAMGVRVDGNDKVTYCHFDCYPDGLGKSIVKDVRTMLKRKSGIGGMRTLARTVRLIEKGSVASREDQDRFVRFSDTGVAGQSLSDWYCLLRNLQGNLKLSLDAGVMIDSHDFLAYSLFCEYAYIVNLDDEKLECYRGFQEKKHNKGRYAEMPMRDRGEKDKYWPVALVGSFDLIDIPRDWANQAYPQDEE